MVKNLSIAADAKSLVDITRATEQFSGQEN